MSQHELALPKEKLKQVRAQGHVLEGKERSKRNQSLLFFVYHCQRTVQRQEATNGLAEGIVPHSVFGNNLTGIYTISPNLANPGAWVHLLGMPSNLISQDGPLGDTCVV